MKKFTLFTRVWTRLLSIPVIIVSISIVLVSNAVDNDGGAAPFRIIMLVVAGLGAWIFLRSFFLGASVASGVFTYRGLVSTRRVPISTIRGVTHGEDAIFYDLAQFFVTIPALEIAGRARTMVLSSLVVTNFSEEKMFNALYSMLGIDDDEPDAQTS